LFPPLVVLFALAHLSHHLVTALPVPLLPFIRDEFGLDYTRAALVVSAFSIPYGLGQLPAGWLADRFGARRLILLGISGVSLAGLAVGLSTQYVALLIALGVMGALGGGYHPSAPPLISAVTEPSRRGRALGVHMIGGSASYFLAPLIAAALAAVWGWRMPFVGLAIPSIIYGVVFFVILGRRERAAVSSPAPAVRPVVPSEGRIDWPSMAAFLVLTGVSAATVLSVVSFIPLYLVDVYGYAEHTAALPVALFYSTGLWAAVTGGWLSDRIGSVRVVAGFAVLSAPVVAVLSLFGSDVAVVALLLLLGIGMYARAPASEAYIVGRTPAKQRSSVLGLYYFGSMEGSGVLAPVFGYLIDRFGFEVAFAAGGVALFAVAIACVLVLRHSHSGN
jgi:predicted MFS family arabinose efflux permease